MDKNRSGDFSGSAQSSPWRGFKRSTLGKPQMCSKSHTNIWGTRVILVDLGMVEWGEQQEILRHYYWTEKLDHMYDLVCPFHNVTKVMSVSISKKTLLDKSLEISLWKLVERTEKHWQVESMETLEQRDGHQLGKKYFDTRGIFN